jgi:ion channel-forming bestrophin family protein
MLHLPGMFVKKRYPLLMTLNWSRKGLILGACISLVVVSLHDLLHWKWLALPWQPISLIGIALAFYLGFKNNSSYDRTWEARKIWGGIVNYSRSFSAMIMGYVSNLHATHPHSEEKIYKEQQTLIHRHIAWLTALRFQLRTPRSWEHNDQRVREHVLNFHSPDKQSDIEAELEKLLGNHDYNWLMGKSNRAAQLLLLQTQSLARLRTEGLIDDFRHTELQSMITNLYEEQGKCERIKNFPFPRQYATVTYFFVMLFAILMPFGIINFFDEMGPGFVWLTVPFSAMLTWVFVIMEMIGDFSENPFEGTYNDVPITSIARTIEIDMREMLGEKEIPKPHEARDGFLM